MNQVDPKTGIINFEIGKELLRLSSRGSHMDFATRREREETSAHFGYDRNSSDYVTSNEENSAGYLSKFSNHYRSNIIFLMPILNALLEGNLNNNFIFAILFRHAIP